MTVIRRQLRVGTIDGIQAEQAVTDLFDFPMTVFPTAPLLRRAWELRDNLTAYDACYVALAEILGCGLLTADTRLSRSPGTMCLIEVI